MVSINDCESMARRCYEHVEEPHARVRYAGKPSSCQGIACMVWKLLHRLPLDGFGGPRMGAGITLNFATLLNEAPKG
jgi:hypothetical protein